MPQKGKGHRDLISTRVPPGHKQVYRREAERYGLHLSDYLALRLAEMHKLERPAWIHAKPTGTQGVLT